MKVLLTGGTGYIASHTAVVLSEAGYEVILYDNLSNSSVNVVNHIHDITGKKLPFVLGDVRDTKKLLNALQKYKIEAVIHFAGLKVVGESLVKPLEYYDNNINGTLSLLKAMEAFNISLLIFSSTANVYGEPDYLPIDEFHSTSVNNPYGRSKLYIENILSDMVNKELISACCLRYFNPVGAHDSGLIGENCYDIPNNLMPYILKVASGKLPYLNIYGDDYNTPDGTGVRDYIHVMDLAEGHLSALQYLDKYKDDKCLFKTFNLGTGKGFSVLEMLKAFEGATGQNIPFKITERRTGDIATSYANVDKALAELKWRFKRDIILMCHSAWNFQETTDSKNFKV